MGKKRRPELWLWRLGQVLNLREYKLRQRVLISGLVPVGIMGLAMGLSIFQAYRVLQIQAILTKSDLILLRILSVQAQANEIRALVQNNLMERRGYEAFRGAYRRLDRGIQSDLEEALRASTDRRLPESVAVEAIVSQYLVEQKQLLDQNLDVFRLLERGQQEEAVRLWLNRAGGRLDVQLSKTQRNAEQLAVKIRERLTRELEVAIYVLGLVLLGGLGLSAWASLSLGRYISDTIGEDVEQRVGDATKVIIGGVERQETMARAQTDLVEETTRTMEQMGYASQEMAQDAIQTAEVAVEMSSLSKQGLSVVGQTQREIEGLEQNVEQIAERIMQLSEQTEQISQVSGSVADIAVQTNILALNAAVEAARAGEEGRGFTVVATEIRKLADQTKGFADRITSLIGEIQDSINSTVLVTDTGSKSAHRSRELMDATAQFFTNIDQMVERITANTSQILSSSKSQVLGVQESVNLMNNIELQAKETQENITAIREAVLRLREVVQSFKEEA